MIQAEILNSLYFIIGVSFLVLVVGACALFYGNLLHPKRKFLVLTKQGIIEKDFRIYNGEFVTASNLLEIFLNKIRSGFSIKAFTVDYIGKKKLFGVSWTPCFLAQEIEGRIFPLPISAALGTAELYFLSCPKCKTIFDYGTDKCKKCGGKGIVTSKIVSNVELEEMRFTDELEKRNYFVQGLENNLIPVVEWIEKFDTGQKIAELMARTDEEARGVLEKHSPILTVLISVLPLGIILFAFAFAFYIMFSAFGHEYAEATTNLKAASENMLILYNMTQNLTVS